MVDFPWLWGGGGGPGPKKHRGREVQLATAAESQNAILSSDAVQSWNVRGTLGKVCKRSGARHEQHFEKSKNSTFLALTGIGSSKP